MRNAGVRDWLVDSVVVGCLAGIGVFVLLPGLCALFVGLSLQIEGTLYRAFLSELGELLASALVGGLLGVAGGRLIRHRKLGVALLPSIVLGLFCFLHLSFSAIRYPWGQSWFDFVLVANWLVLIAASRLCATWALHRRDRDRQAPRPASL
jgi:hypothetical protein